jgi:hypothetical protein
VLADDGTMAGTSGATPPSPLFDGSSRRMTVVFCLQHPPYYNKHFGNISDVAKNIVTPKGEDKKNLQR